MNQEVKSSGFCLPFPKKRQDDPNVQSKDQESITSLDGILSEIKKVITTMDLNIGDREYESNSICYDQDNWLIEAEFRMKGIWNPEDGYDFVRGKVTELSVEHYNEDTGEEESFSENDLSAFCDSINSILNNLN